jgi:D-3-phosphoglycerate dehydrogenase
MINHILITSGPMRAMWAELREERLRFPADYALPDVMQNIVEEDLVRLIPEFDGWVAGTESITERVLTAGRAGRLKALVRWGVGTDNVDIAAAERLGIAVDRTEGVFADEVSDLGVGYMLALARQIVIIDRQVRSGEWLRPAGLTVSGKTVGVVGYGSIGRRLVQKLQAFSVNIHIYSRHAVASGEVSPRGCVFRAWPDEVEDVDFLILVGSLTEHSRNMIDASVINRLKPSAFIVNLGRGAMIDERALIDALRDRRIAGAALDVFAVEPLPSTSPLRQFEQVILGSHNASNTREGAIRASQMALERLFKLV